MRFASADNPKSGFKLIFPRKKDTDYAVLHHPGPATSSSSRLNPKGASDWLLYTLRDKDRPNTEIRVCPISNPGAWKVGGAPSYFQKYIICKKQNRKKFL